MTYSLTGDTSGGGFPINATTGVITVADGSKIDYESSPGHAIPVTVQASDGTLTSSQTFTINVGDVALTTPVDTNGAANSVAEGAAAGTARRHHRTRDRSERTGTTYSLIGDTSAGGFTIKRPPASSPLLDAAKIDFENRAGHSLPDHRAGLQRRAQPRPRCSPIGVTNVAPSAPTDSNGAANTVVEGAANGTAVGITASSTDVNGPAR